MQIDYDEMGLYFSKSARTLRRWEKEKPQKFEIMLEEFVRESETTNNSSDSSVIVIANLKGGAGKSTMADALGYYLGDAAILNTDIGQAAESINATKTYDYVRFMEEHSVVEMINELKKKYRYVIVDTPGEAASTDEIYSALTTTDKVIIPFTVGKRAREATIRTLDVFFGKYSKLKGDFNIYFLINSYVDEKKKLEASVRFTKEFEYFLKNKLSDDIKIKAKLGNLKYSQAIVTAEEEGKSITMLAQENRGAYRTVLSRILNVCKNIENNFKL